MLEPFFREAGTGPGVVCLHSNASTSGQWRGLMDGLAPKFHVLAPDSYGAGKSPDWPSARRIRLLDEVAFIEPVLARAGSPLALVGHSYGAAVALIAALANPGRVRAMALYEPVLFGLLDAEAPPPNEADGIRDAVASAGLALEAGNPGGGRRHRLVALRGFCRPRSRGWSFSSSTPSATWARSPIRTWSTTSSPDISSGTEEDST